MGTASLVLGIISFLLSCLPFCNGLGALLAIIGLILGIVGASTSKEKKGQQGQSIAGIILTILAILMVIVYGMSAISTSDTKSTSSKTNSSSTSSKTKVYDVGQTAKIGNWEITVLETEDTKSLGTAYPKTTENNYIIVKMRIKNLSSEAGSPLTTSTQVTTSSVGIYTRSEFELYDGKSSYVADYNLEGYVNDSYSIMFNKINPNTSVIYSAVFETDKTSDQKDYKLRLDSNKDILLKIK